MAGPITVRRAVSDDARDLLTFTLALVRETEKRDLDAAVVGRGIEAALREPSGRTYYVVERDGKRIGQCFVTTEWSDWTGRWYWWLQSVFVVPAARGSGVFEALWEKVRADARAAGVRTVKLYVHESNARAMRVYERVGLAPAHYRMFEAEV